MSEALEGYYRWHARIYDVTRWAFLFGRRELIRRASARLHPRSPRRILEVGCGTGTNLAELARCFPGAELVGVDLSAAMLEKARRKAPGATLRHGAYVAPVAEGRPFDLIVCSYCLTMINPGYDEVLRLCREDLSAEGEIAVVDFHDSGWAWFRRWMGLNHVRMEGQVLGCLSESGWRVEWRVREAYGGLWRWVECFAGRR